MLGRSVNFSGISWPKTQATRSESIVFAVPAGKGPPVRQQTFDITAAGRPRIWSTNETQGFWPGFVTTFDSNNEFQLAAFVARRGDPYGELNPDHSVNTGAWSALRTMLDLIAGAWEPEDADGVSRISRDPARISDTTVYIRNSVATFGQEVILAHGPPGLVVHQAVTLAGYMWFSAVSAFERRVPMRRCAHCTAWFELNRVDALYCSGACRTAHHALSKKED